MQLCKKSPEGRPVTRGIQMIGNIVVSVLAGHFVNLGYSLLGRLERPIPRRSTVDEEIGQHTRAPSYLHIDFPRLAHTN